MKKKNKAFLTLILLSSFLGIILNLLFEFKLVEKTIKNQLIITLVGIFIEIIIIKIIEKIFKL